MVRAILKDPTSAQFRNDRKLTKEGRLAYCGEVNAKNSLGAYTGFERYVVSDYAIFMGVDAVVFNGADSSLGAGAVGYVAIEVVKSKTENANLEERLRQLHANVSNPALGNKTTTDIAWEKYCDISGIVDSVEEKCKKDLDYHKSIYNEQMESEEYRKALHVKVPASCSSNAAVVKEIEAMALEAEKREWLKVAADNSAVLIQRSVAISNIMEKFPDAALAHKIDLEAWEVDIKKQKGRKFTDEECFRMKSILPQVANNISMKKGIDGILSDADTTEFRQAYDAMLQWVTQYDASSLLRHSYDMAYVFGRDCVSGKIRNGYRKK